MWGTIRKALQTGMLQTRRLRRATTAAGDADLDVTCQFTQVAQQGSSGSVLNGAILLHGGQRQPDEPGMHLILVVDSSKPMLGNVKRAMQLLPAMLCARDRVSVVSFCIDAQTILRRVAPGAYNTQAVLHQVEGLGCGSGTNLSAALLEARALIEAAADNRSQHLVLFTDGHATSGLTDNSRIMTIVELIKAESPHLNIHTIAYASAQPNEALLKSMASYGNGEYITAKSFEGVAHALRDMFSDSRLFLRDLEVEFPYGSQPTLARSFKVKSNSETGSTTVVVGDLQPEADILIPFRGPVDMDSIFVCGTKASSGEALEVEVDVQQVSSMDDVHTPLLLAATRHRVADTLVRVGQKLAPPSEADSLRCELQQAERISGYLLTKMLCRDLDAVSHRLHRSSSYSSFLQQECQEEAYFPAWRRLLQRTSSKALLQRPSCKPPTVGLAGRSSRGTSLEEAAGIP